MNEVGELPLEIDDPQQLAEACLPFVSGGGLYIANSGAFALGQKVRLRLQRGAGRGEPALLLQVVLIVPAGSQGNLPQGVGLGACRDDEASAQRLSALVAEMEAGQGV